MIEIIKKLEVAGFVSRQAHPEHGRIIQTVLTESGRNKLATTHEVVGQIEEKTLAGLTVEDRESLVEYLQYCVDNLGG